MYGCRQGEQYIQKNFSMNPFSKNKQKIYYDSEFVNKNMSLDSQYFSLPNNEFEEKNVSQKAEKFINFGIKQTNRKKNRSLVSINSLKQKNYNNNSFLSLNKQDDSIFSIIVNFKIHKHVNYGQAIYITGNLAEIGQWDSDRAVRMQWSEGDLWSISVNFLFRNECYGKMNQFQQSNMQRNIEYRYFVADYQRIQGLQGFSHSKMKQKQYGWTVRKIDIHSLMMKNNRITEIIDVWNVLKIKISVSDKQGTLCTDLKNKEKYYFLSNSKNLQKFGKLQQMKNQQKQNNLQQSSRTIDFQISREVQKIHYFIFKKFEQNVFLQTHFGHFMDLTLHRHHKKEENSLLQNKSIPIKSSKSQKYQNSITYQNSIVTGQVTQALQVQDEIKSTVSKYAPSLTNSKVFQNSQYDDKQSFISSSRITQSDPFKRKSNIFEKCDCKYPKGEIKINVKPEFKLFQRYQMKFDQVKSSKQSYREQKSRINNTFILSKKNKDSTLPVQIIDLANKIKMKSRCEDQSNPKKISISFSLVSINTLVQSFALSLTQIKSLYLLNPSHHLKISLNQAGVHYNKNYLKVLDKPYSKQHIHQYLYNFLVWVQNELIRNQKIDQKVIVKYTLLKTRTKKSNSHSKQQPYKKPLNLAINLQNQLSLLLYCLFYHIIHEIDLQTIVLRINSDLFSSSNSTTCLANKSTISIQQIQQLIKTIL